MVHSMVRRIVHLCVYIVTAVRYIRSVQPRQMGGEAQFKNSESCVGLDMAMY